MVQLETVVSAYVELYLQLMRTLDRRMAAEGASLARTKLLLCLQKRGPMRGTDIAEFFSLSPRTVTEAIDALERERMLERHPDPSDRRAKLIHITAKGLAAAAKTEPLRHQIIESTFGKLDAAERETLITLLEKVAGPLLEPPSDNA